MSHTLTLAALLVLSSAVATTSYAQTLPPEISARSGESAVAVWEAYGAQIYECKTNAAGKLEWQFREPIATLIYEGKTVGRHYAGPNWEHADGSAVSGKVSGKAPGATSDDILLLRLDGTSRGSGLLSGVTAIQRIDTKGGVMQGACDKAGEVTAKPYSCSYVFLKPKS